MVANINNIDTERFIVEVEARPALWNTLTEEYTDRDLKKRCWDEIVDIFMEEELDALARKEYGDALQKKWKGIRGCYTREINRQKALKLGADVGSRKSEYVYFKQLNFLRNVVISAREPDPHRTALVYSQDEVAPKRKKVEIVIDEQTSNSVEAREERLEEDEDKMFLLSLVSTFKKVPEHRKMATRIKILSVLEEASQGTGHLIWNQEPETLECHFEAKVQPSSPEDYCSD